MSQSVSRQQLEAAHCWEEEDRVPGRPEMTEFRRRLRYHQALWREANGHPIGSQPIATRPGAPRRPVGSRLPLAYARETGASFVTPGALQAARARTLTAERNQSFDHQRLWADLLWSPSLAFNLFGELAREPLLATRALCTWIPDVSGRVSEVRFSHSPGWLDPAYLNSLRVFDAAFVLDRGSRSRAIVAFDIKYHERRKAETPRPENLSRYVEVALRSGVFKPGAIEALKIRSDLAVMWLEHLLLLSMLQHVSGTWQWGRYVVVHPAGNTDFAEACARYNALLDDESTFCAITLGQLLEADALPSPVVAALRERYLPGSDSTSLGV
jgi:hypothetical protein